MKGTRGDIFSDEKPHIFHHIRYKSRNMNRGLKPTYLLKYKKKKSKKKKGHISKSIRTITAEWNLQTSKIKISGEPTILFLVAIKIILNSISYTEQAPFPMFIYKQQLEYLTDLRSKKNLSVIKGLKQRELDSWRSKCCNLTLLKGNRCLLFDYNILYSFTL